MECEFYNRAGVLLGTQAECGRSGPKKGTVINAAFEGISSQRWQVLNLIPVSPDAQIVIVDSEPLESRDTGDNPAAPVKKFTALPI
jgi:hypothetical protein